MNEELKPCKACKNPSVKMHKGTNQITCRVWCDTPFCAELEVVGQKEDAAKEWNKRNE